MNSSDATPASAVKGTTSFTACAGQSAACNGHDAAMRVAARMRRRSGKVFIVPAF